MIPSTRGFTYFVYFTVLIIVIFISRILRFQIIHRESTHTSTVKHMVTANVSQVQYKNLQRAQLLYSKSFTPTVAFDAIYLDTKSRSYVNTERIQSLKFACFCTSGLKCAVARHARAFPATRLPPHNNNHRPTITN